MGAKDYVGLFKSYSSIGAEFWIVTIALVLAVVLNIGHIAYVLNTARYERLLNKNGILRLVGSSVAIITVILVLVYMPSTKQRKSDISEKAMAEYNVSDIDSLGKNIKYLNKKLDELKK